jgi:hypothetical protein
MPIAVFLLSTIPLAIFFAISFLKLPAVLRIPASIEVGLTLILFMTSYYLASFMDAGYLPFDWYRTKKFKYSWQEQLDGLAVRPDQKEFAKTYRPTYASFSGSFGRFVIRGDHICFWIGQWVAKRNHKQFLLLNFWGGIYGLSLMVWTLFGKEVLSVNSFVRTALVLFAFGIEMIFSISMLWVFFSSLNDLKNNVTTIQKWKADRGEQRARDYNCNQSMREVCGHGTCLCWMCPTYAFQDDLAIREGDLPPESDNLFD